MTPERILILGVLAAYGVYSGVRISDFMARWLFTLCVIAALSVAAMTPLIYTEIIPDDIGLLPRLALFPAGIVLLLALSVLLTAPFTGLTLLMRPTMRRIGARIFGVSSAVWLALAALEGLAR